MAKFLNSDLADLAHQLEISPRRQRVGQVQGVDRLLGVIDPDKSYPFEFVCYEITGFRKRGASTSASVPGSVLLTDLVLLGETLSRKANLTVEEIGEPILTHQEVADLLGVSTKTVRRWRSRGLMGLRCVFDDGVNRLAFCRKSVERFQSQNEDLVSKGASFRQMTEAEKMRVIDRARQLVARNPIKLHAAAKIIAEETGRAVETIRYTLRRHDSDPETVTIFDNGEAAFASDVERATWEMHERGDSVADIAAALGISQGDVESTVRLVRFMGFVREPVQYIHNEVFESSAADRLILDAPEPEAEAPKPVRVPNDLPHYLQMLYRTPLLSREQEQDLFRRFNYVKFKAAKLVEKSDPETLSAKRFAEIESLLEEADGYRRRIIKANLRLVVSIAKKHVGWSPAFFETVSDGNLSLMRAVENFDYARGNKFSTYASWAIMKNYARSIPEQQYKYSRFVTGQDVTLDAAPAEESGEPLPSEREEVRLALEEGIASLPERERRVVRAHFGLAEGEEPRTLEQIGESLGVTKERVRQIEKKALQSLREVLSPSMADALTS